MITAEISPQTVLAYLNVVLHKSNSSYERLGGADSAIDFNEERQRSLERAVLEINLAVKLSIIHKVMS